MNNLKCEIKKGTSKLGKIYYFLYIEELDKSIFLNSVEVKVLKLLKLIKED